MSNIELNDKDFSIKYPGILEILLLDRTTKKNLIYATDNYMIKGHNSEDYIEYNHLVNAKRSLIRPRMEKSLVEQKKRSKDMAEVFTPSWVCNKQNNMIDNEWFGYDGVFNKELENKWESTNIVNFKENKWEDYIDLERLEITCGEAPYLTSRYDAVNGIEIETHNRIGLLDRKLRVISENTATKEDFTKYCYIAYKRIYGFDFQGDNVLIARKNLFYDFIEFYMDKFNEEPLIEILTEIAKIISYNIFQMDGIKFVIPYSCHKEQSKEMSLFEEYEPMPVECCGCKTGDHRKHNGVYATIKDWRKNKIVRFIDLTY